MRNFINIVENATSGFGTTGIDRVIDQSSKMGVNLKAGEDDAGIWIDMIERTTGDKGSGKAVLDILCQYADAVGKEITLYVESYAPALERLYRSVGFEQDNREDDEAYMVRYPSGASPD